MSDLVSQIRTKLNQSTAADSPGGSKITADELQEMKKIAAKGGTVGLVDVNNQLSSEIANEPDGPEKTAKLDALQQIRQVASASATAQSDGIIGALATIDKLNPFAYIRWGLGGPKPGHSW